MISLFGKPEPTLAERLKASVSKTKAALSETVDTIFLGEKKVDPALLKQLETTLISADLGVGTTREILDAVREQLDRNALSDASQLKTEIKSHIVRILNASAGSKPAQPAIVAGSPNGKGPRVIFIAVVYDAVAAAKARSSDAVIVDTAGRLHTKSNLMAELEKMKRTAAKLIPGAPHDVLLVLDATTGQNGLAQAREFTSTVGVTGIILTKLDGTAKGGIVVAISRELALPIRFVGTGEQINDLVPFDAEIYVNSLFD